MKLFVNKNQEQFGPFEEAEVRAKLAAGEFHGSDLAWHDGLTGWQPLERVLGIPSGAPGSMAAIPAQNSGLATASFIISIVAFLGWIALFAVAGMRAGSGVRPPPGDPVLMMVGLLTLAVVSTNFVGAILGLVVVAKPAPNRWMAITGLIFNGLQFLGIVMLFVIVLAIRHR